MNEETKLKITTVNRDLETFEERKNFLSTKYNNLQSIYDNITEDNTSCNDEEDIDGRLTQDVYECRCLEYDANYLLQSKEVESKNSLSKSLKEYDSQLNAEYGEFRANYKVAENTTATSNKTLYVNTKTTIKKSDFNNKKYGDILKQYNLMREFLVAENTKIKNRENSDYSLRRNLMMLNAINHDMKLVKQYYTEIVTYEVKSEKKHYIGNADYWLDVVDYTNTEHMSALLKNLDLMQDITPNDNLSHIAYDLKCMLDKLHRSKVVSDDDVRLVTLVQQTDLTMEEIADILLVTRKTIYNRWNNIVKKICTYNEKKELYHN